MPTATRGSALYYPPPEKCRTGGRLIGGGARPPGCPRCLESLAGVYTDREHLSAAATNISTLYSTLYKNPRFPPHHVTRISDCGLAPWRPELALMSVRTSSSDLKPPTDQSPGKRPATSPSDPERPQKIRRLSDEREPIKSPQQDDVGLGHPLPPSPSLTQSVGVSSYPDSKIGCIAEPGLAGREKAFRGRFHNTETQSGVVRSPTFTTLVDYPISGACTVCQVEPRR